MVGGRAWVYLSISFEVHQIKGSKITDMDEVAIDSDGICVSERGPGELPAARGDLGMLKPGQASKEKNCQVLGGRSMRSAAAEAPLLGVTAWFGRGFHGDLIADLPPGSLLLQLPWQDRAFSSQFTYS